MSSNIGSHAVRALRALAIALAAPAALSAGSIPAALAPDDDGVVRITLAARGVQVYECKRTGDRYEWTFVAPEADLLDADGRVVGHHGAGPSWEASDGSRIVGSVKARVDAPVMDAVPWLLLTARSVGGDGVLGKVTSVQRVHTAGGVAPRSPCRDDTLAAIARVPYTADYVFLGARPPAARDSALSQR
jgi:hypothetical protein